MHIGVKFSYYSGSSIFIFLLLHTIEIKKIQSDTRYLPKVVPSKVS
jgi:hypothetical protein